MTFDRGWNFPTPNRMATTDDIDTELGDLALSQLYGNPDSLLRLMQEALMSTKIANEVPEIEAFTRREPGVRYVPVAGVIRNTGGVWDLIHEDGSHEATGISEIIADSTKIRVVFETPATRVGTFLCNVDETFATEGYYIGASVAKTWADVFIYKRQGPVGGYVTFNGTSWTSSAHLGVDTFRNFSWSGNTLYMEHDAVKPAATNLMVSVTGRGAGLYTYRIGSISSNVTRVEVYNMAGAAVTVPAADMQFYVLRGSDGVNLVNPLTMAEGFANLWLIGQNEIVTP